MIFVIDELLFLVREASRWTKTVGEGKRRVGEGRASGCSFYICQRAAHRQSPMTPVCNHRSTFVATDVRRCRPRLVGCWLGRIQLSVESRDARVALFALWTLQDPDLSSTVRTASHTQTSYPHRLDHKIVHLKYDGKMCEARAQDSPGRKWERTGVTSVPCPAPSPTAPPISIGDRHRCLHIYRCNGLVH